ncbi:MAG: polysaccharide biosynthesis/export family protein [Sedimentisphaerales bacterium]|nr:polysaccharide biosynthesis/export family protein [Sedimentisphaerales bacterium]
MGLLSAPHWGNRVCVAVVIIVAACMFCLSGCEGPGAIGRYRSAPVTNIILDSLGVVDEGPEEFAGARDPRQEDLSPRLEEYVIGPGDVLDISIFELFSTNTPYAERMQVSDTGRITLPIIGTLPAAGRTELELTDDLIARLKPTILKDPKVNVVVTGSAEKVFSISGAVAAPGRYPMSEADFRISEALAQAGGIPQTNVDYAYVIRSAPMVAGMQATDTALFGADRVEVREMAEPDREPVQTLPSPEQIPVQEIPVEPQITPQQEQEELLESLKPMMMLSSGNNSAIDTRREAFAPENLLTDAVLSTTRSTIRLTDDVMTVADVNVNSGVESNQFKAVREDGRFRLTPIDGETSPLPEIPTEPYQPAAPQETPQKFDYAGMDGQTQEVIRVNLRKLRSGDLSQNIVIQPGDDIQLPFNATGIFYVAGQVARPGSYSLTGDRLTLKQALVAAGPMTSLAWPSRCEITRRIGANREVTYRVDVEKLFQGTAPDVFVKANDIINVGSHPVAQFVAVIRQSFRATYGFGFVYDRNLADKDFGH